MKIRKPDISKMFALTALIAAAGFITQTRAGVTTNLVVLPVASSLTEGIAASNVTVATFTDPGSAVVGVFAARGVPLFDIPIQVDDITNYSAVIDWGDGTPPDSNVTFVANGSGGLDVLGSHTYLEEGTNWVVVSISDIDDSVGSTTSEAIVKDAALHASGTSIAPIEGIPFSGQVASFTDENPFAPLDDFTAVITWGDDSQSQGSISAGPEGGFVVSGSHTYGEKGSYGVRVRITDVGGSRACAGSTASVLDAPLTANGVTIHPTESIAFDGVVATFADANTSSSQSDFVAQINWGDGTLSTYGTIVAGEPGSYSVSGSHVYADEGSYDITVSIVDVDLNSVQAGSTAVVGDAALSAEGEAISPVEGAPFTLRVATFTDQNTNATVSEFTATINWGDESENTLAVISSNDSGGFDVTGSHTYAEHGTYAVSVKIIDQGGSTAAAGSTANVSDAGLSSSGKTLSPVEGAPFTSVVASLSDANPFALASDYTVVITWGDGSTSAGNVTAAEGGFNVAGSHTYIEEGSYSINVEIEDIGGSVTSAASTANVADAPISSIPRAITPFENTAFYTVVASVYDTNPYGTADDFQASIDWGDGSVSSGTISSNAVSHFDVLGSHTYAHEGLYPVTVTVQDSGGSSTVANSVAHTMDTGMVGTGTTINAVKGVPFTNIVATCTDNDPTPEATNAYSCLINWGDGSTSPGTIIEGENDTYTIVGSHTYLQTGSYVVMATIDDSVNALSTSARSTALVGQPPATDLTSQMQIKATRPRLDRRTGYYKQVLTVKNMSGQMVPGPISIVFDNLHNDSEGGSVSLVNKDGTIQSPAAAPVGSPYKNLGLPKNQLLVRKGTKAITVFFDGGSPNIGYSIRVLTGTGAR